MGDDIDDPKEIATSRRKPSATERLRQNTQGGRKLFAEGSWSGWIWRRRKKLWEHCCCGDSLGECSRTLSEVARERGVPDRETCLTRGSCPSRTPAAR